MGRVGFLDGFGLICARAYAASPVPGVGGEGGLDGVAEKCAGEASEDDSRENKDEEGFELVA